MLNHLHLLDVTFKVPSQVNVATVVGNNYLVLIVCLSHAASQMWELFNIFPFIIDTILDVDDPHHACLMLLNDIATILYYCAGSDPISALINPAVP